MVQVLSFRPYLRTIATKVKEKLADVVVATSGGCNERSMWDLQSFEVLFKHNWDINECLGHIGDALMFVFFFLILSCLETMLTYGDHSMAVDPANSHWSHIYLNGANSNANRREVNSILGTAAISVELGGCSVTVETWR